MIDVDGSDNAFAILREYGVPPPAEGPGGETIAGCVNVTIESGMRPVQRHYGAPMQMVRTRQDSTRASFLLSGGGERAAEWWPETGWVWIPETDHHAAL